MPTHIMHNSSKISDRSQKFAIDQFLHYNFWKNLKSITKFQRSFLRLIALFTIYYCSLMFIFCTVNFAIDRKKFLWNFLIDHKFERNCTESPCNTVDGVHNSNNDSNNFTNIMFYVGRQEICCCFYFLFFFSFLLYVLVSYWLAFIQKW